MRQYVARTSSVLAIVRPRHVPTVCVQSACLSAVRTQHASAQWQRAYCAPQHRIESARHMRPAKVILHVRRGEATCPDCAHYKMKVAHSSIRP
eukprot:6205911-Pleurochrysis_carterae.AAC.4